MVSTPSCKILSICTACKCANTCAMFREPNLMCEKARQFAGRLFNFAVNLVFALELAFSARRRSNSAG